MKIFIHTNNKQLLGAKVSAFMYKKIHGINDVEIINTDDMEFFKSLHKKKYLRNKKFETFNNNDLQSFTLSRFVPESITKDDYLIHDPDVFPIKNPIDEINKINVKNKKIETLFAVKNKNNNLFYSSVFFHLNRKKKLWVYEELINQIFKGTRDYHDLIQLVFHDIKVRIAEIDETFNSFDKLNNKTILLHNTARLTQPWKTGLKVDFINHKLNTMGRLKWFFKKPLYLKHPDKNQETLFMKNLNDSLNDGFIEEKELKEAIKNKWIRPDTIDILRKI